MSQGFTHEITIPVPVSQGGTGVTTSTGSGSTVLNNNPNLIGTATNDDAAAGSIGEYITSNLPNASATALTTNVAKDVTSISLTAGDWDVFGTVTINCGSNANTNFYGWISTVSAAFPDNSVVNGCTPTTGTLTLAAICCLPVRVSISGTTTVYLSAYCTFTLSATACGTISARRAR